MLLIDQHDLSLRVSQAYIILRKLRKEEEQGRIHDSTSGNVAGQGQ